MASTHPVLEQIVAETPWLLSPMALAKHDLGKDYDVTPHVKLLNKTVFNLVRGEYDRAVINAPFRASKSVTATQYLSAWYLMWHPDHEVKVFCYSQNLADKFGYITREIVKRHGKTVGIRLQSDYKARAQWRIDGHRG